jgi:AraC family transcriptional regulator
MMRNEGVTGNLVRRLLQAADCARRGQREAAQFHISGAIDLLRDSWLGARVISGLAEGRLSAHIAGALPAWRARRVIAYIEANLAGALSLQGMAQQAGLSVSHFSRKFTRRFGMSPHAFVIARRIEFAKELMLRTPDPLSRIALSCGMSDQAHFCKAFRRLVGESPGRWRTLSCNSLPFEYGYTGDLTGADAPESGTREIAQRGYRAALE